VKPHTFNADHTIHYAQVTLDKHPEFTITAWEHRPLPNDGLNDNECWPSNMAPNDPGYALNTYDKWYSTQATPYPYDYRAAYNPPVNGV
jgi:hypothetical protein